MRRCALATLVALTIAAGPAGGADPPNAGRGESEVYETVILRFTTAAAGARTGLRWNVRQRSVGSDEQPPPVRRTRIRFPRGTRFDQGAVPRCRASRDDLERRGAAACPARSRVGGGTGTIYVGSPEHLAFDATVVNARGSLLLILTTESGSVLRILRGVLRGSVVDAKIPRVPLPNGREAALTSVSVRVRAAGSRSRPFIRTPRACPARRAWRFVYDIEYDDPPGDQRPYDLSRCRRP